MVAEVHRYILPAAFALLPEPMQSERAAAMVLAIGLQESRFLHRRQLENGPAHGFWMFEHAGVVGVLRHPRSQPAVDVVLRILRYALEPGSRSHLVYAALPHNDILAACFARLLLWTVPGELPGPDDAAIGWEQYREGWRPGKPRRETWDSCYGEAWTRVLMGRPQ